jgi:hypothetical protein
MTDVAPKKPKIVQRLDRFMETWLSNPEARRDFALLVRDVHEHPSFDHADAPLVEWIDDQLQTAKRLGVR